MGAMAQGNFYALGTVTDPNGATVANQTVCITTDSSVQTAFTYSDCVQTDSIGRYAFGIPGGATPGPNIVYIVSIYACGAAYTEHIQNAQGTVNMVTHDFALGCNPNATSCVSSFSFTQSPTNSHIVNFQAGVPVNTYFYNWTFGDGTQASTYDPPHTFSDTGWHQVCLTIYNSNGCQDQFCDYVYIADSSTTNPPACQSSFSYYVSNGQVHFYQTAGDSLNPYSYYWSFGGGNTASGADVWHSFANSGLLPGDTANVCLTIYNSAGCQNTACQNVIVPGATSGGGCSAAFTWSDSAGYVFFNLTGSVISGASYHYDFGNGTSANDASVVRQLAAGTYAVCLSVYNPADSCSNQSCQTIVVGDTSNIGCQASFTYTVSPANANSIYFQATVPANTYFYNWSFGDGTQASTADPTHTFTNGQHTVCLTIYNSTGCQDSVCHTFTVGGIQTYDIDGTVTFNTNDAATPGYVRLIEIDSTNGGLSLVQVAATATDSLGHYHFGGVAYGNYFIKAELSPNSPAYATHLPTYYGNVLFWSSATSVTAGNPNTGYNIQLVNGNNPGGPGFIGGLVSQGANKTEAEGDPIAGSQVMILNMTNDAFLYLFTGSDGTFSFSSLPYGTYQVYTEVVGLPTTPVIVTIEPGNTTITDVQVVISSTDVATGIEKTASVVEVKGLYPNPAKDNVNINLSNLKESNISIQVTNVAGVEILSQAFKAGKGENTVSLPISGLTEGVYFVKITAAGSNQIVRRFVKL